MTFEGGLQMVYLRASTFQSAIVLHHESKYKMVHIFPQAVSFMIPTTYSQLSTILNLIGAWYLRERQRAAIQTLHFKFKNAALRHQR